MRGLVGHMFCYAKAPPLRVSPSASSFLDLSRWVGAFLVLIHHVRHIIFIDYVGVENKTLLNKSFYFLTGLGHEALVAFFVSSGFLVGGLCIENSYLRNFRKISYFSNRIARIYTVLVPALLLGAIVDRLGYLYFNNAHLYTDSLQYKIDSLDWNIIENLNWNVFLGNLLMLQGSQVPMLGSNGPLWSLAYEWWYYVIFAIAMMVISTKRIYATAAYVAIAIILIFTLSPLIFLWGAIWGLGILSSWYSKSRLPKPRPITGLVIFFCAVAASRLSHSSEIAEPESVLRSFARDFTLGVGYCMLLASVLVSESKPLFPRLNRLLACFSFSLYSCHFPALIFLVSLFYSTSAEGFQQQPSPHLFAYFTLILTLLVLYGVTFYGLAEAHTNRMHRTLDALLNVVSLRFRGIQILWRSQVFNERVQTISSPRTCEVVATSHRHDTTAIVASGAKLTPTKSGE